MDPESPVSRMERTLWTFWYYVTEAVNRFLRPEPTDIISNDPNSTQEPAVESEPANHAEGEASGRRVDEDQSLATASLFNPSRAAVAWELCTADIDLGPDEESIQCEVQLSRGSESKVSEEGEDTIEEHFTQKESSDAGLPIAKDAKEDEQEENGDRRLYTHGQDEMLENDEYEEYVSTRPLRLTGEAMSEEMEKMDGAGDEETESAMTPDDHQKRDENIGNIQVKEEDDKMHHIDERDLVAEDIEVKLYTISDLSLEEDDMHIEEAKLQRDEADTEVMHEEVQSSDGVLLLASENENKSDGGARQVENQFSVCEELSDDDQDLKGDPGFTSLQAQLQMLHNKVGVVPEDELTVVEREHVMAHRSESDKAEDAKEEEDESTLDEREQGAAIGEENGNEAEKKQSADEVLEQEDTETVTEGREEEDILTCRGKIGQNAETELHTDEFTHVEEEEDVAKDTEVQTKTRETDDVETENSDVTTTEISGDGRFFDECQVEEERLSSDIGKKESYMEIACTTTTVEPEGETGQEIIGEFQNIPHGKCEGRLVVSQELNYPAYEETQEGVPECNNETGPDENTTQWFLEVGVYKETQTTQLPEEVERKEPETLQNSGADHSLVMEHMEEEQDSTEDIKNSFDLVVEEHAGIPCLTDAELPQETEKPLVEPVIQESGLFFEEEEKKLSVDSVKTGVEHSEKKFETEVGLRDEADKTTKELQASENENESEEGATQVENQLSVCEELSDDNQDLKGDPGFTSLQAQLQMLHNKVGVVPEDELTVVGQEHVMAHRSESDKAEDAKEEEDESTLDEREQDAAIGEENGNEAEKNQTADKVLEQEDTETVTEGREEEDILTCRGKIGQNAETELHTDEFTYGEKEEDVAKDTEVQTKTRETDDLETENSDVTTTEISGDGRFFDECQLEEERLSSDIGKKEETEKPLVEPVIQESGLFFEEEEEKLSVDSMKTGVEHSEKEFETEFGLRDEADKTTKELQDGTEELLVEFEIDEGLCDSKEAEAAAGHETTGAAATEVQRMTETNFFQESVDAINSEQNSNMTLSLLDDITESGFQKQSEGSEPNLLEDSAVEMQDAGIDMEETGYAVEEDAAENEMQNKNDVEMLNLQVTGMAAELTTGRNDKENSLIAESELYRAVESLETRNLISDKTLEISNDEVLTDVEVTHVSTTTKSKQKDLTRISTDDMANVTESEGSHAEEMVSSISGRQDVINEEILDLWLQTALPEDSDGIKQQEVSRQRIDMGIEPSNEEQDGISSVQTEKDKELLVESCSEKSEVVSDTDMSSSTVESGFLDQSLSEWGTQNNETQLLKSTSTGSFQGIYDLLANMSESADISELSKQQVNSGSQDSLMGEMAATGQSNVLHPDSRVTSEAKHPNQELDKSQERVETVETETGSRKEIKAEITDLAWDDAWKDTEKADVKSLTEMSAPFKDEPLEITPCDSPDEIKHTETGQTISGSETSSVEGNVLTESVSQGDTCTDSEKLLKLPSLDKPQPGWSEDIADSFPGLNRAGVPTTESENQMEVDASVLDFTAQRSRIAVKNRRVRPPKDPRSLLHMPSVDPTPSSHLPVKVPPGVPLGGLGIGIKLPGFGAGFPVLKKTRQVARDENSQETLPQYQQEPETKPEESDTPKQEEAQHKPKWMPPRHPGFGNPLMSELKTKLKKTTKE
ncbi:myb-like protein X isoform X3 [Micropterus salmoides]|uniref:myb-like protein X isoform X3 n=1 Tax=Micropterus salmoides TaxID=27706 RepID=UPI0018ED4606|nr:myb-like protein X isoform X3 [Micropterus salmoides]